VLQDGGVAIMSTGYGEGEDRVKKAIDDALNSPLLNDNDIFNSKKLLLNISFSHQKDSKDNFMMEEMNYVNEFMERFGNDFVFKWGVAVDPELGKRVKVTILATGFGMQDIDGMEERMAKQRTIEDANRLAAEQEAAAKREERRGQYYGGTDTAKRYKRRPNIYIFGPEDLDNDDVISAVEQTPTYKRTKEVLASIGNQNVVEDVQRPETPETQQGVISFV
jgi:cell division protein FtsZ